MKKAQLFIVFTGFLLTVFGFQNCSAPLPEEEEQTTNSSSADVTFAFNTEIDQLAYMSCHQLGTNFDKSSYFTFRVGAYRAGSGVGLNTKFLESFASVPHENRKTEMVSKAVNKDAQPLLSVRDPYNLQSLYLPSSAGPTIGYDHAKMLGVLTSDSLADELLKDTSQRVRYKRAAAAEGMRLEGDLNLNAGWSGASNLLSSFNNGALLAINYPVKSTNPFLIRSPAQYSTAYPANSVSSQAYGKGLRLSFKRHPATPGSGPAWALDMVHEDNMELKLNDTARATQNKLSCPTSLVFKIVDRRHWIADPNSADTSKMHCEMKADNPAALSAGDQELLRRARLSLRPEDWYIDWARKCIVPKKFDNTSMNQCYGPNSSNVSVEYDLTKPCAEGSVSGARACVALASICIR